MYVKKGVRSDASTRVWSFDLFTAPAKFWDSATAFNGRGDKWWQRTQRRDSLNNAILARNFQPYTFIMSKWAYAKYLSFIVSNDWDTGGCRLVRGAGSIVGHSIEPNGSAFSHRSWIWFLKFHSCYQCPRICTEYNYMVIIHVWDSFLRYCVMKICCRRIAGSTSQVFWCKCLDLWRPVCTKNNLWPRHEMWCQTCDCHKITSRTYSQTKNIICAPIWRVTSDMSLSQNYK